MATINPITHLPIEPAEQPIRHMLLEVDSNAMICGEMHVKSEFSIAQKLTFVSEGLLLLASELARRGNVEGAQYSTDLAVHYAREAGEWEATALANQAFLAANPTTEI